MSNHDACRKESSSKCSKARMRKCSKANLRNLQSPSISRAEWCLGRYNASPQERDCRLYVKCNTATSSITCRICSNARFCRHDKCEQKCGVKTRAQNNQNRVAAVTDVVCKIGLWHRLRNNSPIGNAVHCTPNRLPMPSVHLNAV